jgi:ornithine cyclodeaminase/alanine dehydrogenase-like protein (mu-crystallin family)
LALKPTPINYYYYSKFMQTISADQVRSLGFSHLLQSFREAHRQAPADSQDLFLFEEKSDGRQPNSLLCRAAWRKGQVLGVKLATVFPENADTASNLPTTQAAFILFDGRNGEPIATVDGKSITNVKTATDSALGASILARTDAKVLLMKGAGSVAPDLVAAHCSARPSISTVYIHNRTATKAIALQARLASDPSLGHLNLEVIEDLEAGVREADIVCCATAASEPFLCGRWLKEGAHVDLVGGYTTRMREADDDVMRRGRIFVDTREKTIGVVGDIQTPLEKGIITTADILADLYQLCGNRHAGRTSETDITVFKNGGGGHLDLMAAEAVAAQLLQ